MVRQFQCSVELESVIRQNCAVSAARTIMAHTRPYLIALRDLRLDAATAFFLQRQDEQVESVSSP